MWLASLSRTVLQEGPRAVEDFFVLTDRTPHFIKFLYHLIQGVFVSLSWTAGSARLPSLLAALAVLAFMYVVVRRTGGARLAAFLATAALALDVQFFYISHLGRQEMLLVLLMLAALAVRLRWSGVRGALYTAMLLTPGLLVHPNIFIVALALLPWFGRESFRQTVLELLVYAAVLAGAAVLVAGGSLLVDGGFFTHYRDFGETVGVFAGALARLQGGWMFARKIFLQHAGTYYLPPLQAQLAACAVLLLAALPALFYKKIRGCLWLKAALSLLAVLAAIFVIGKYSPPSIVFILPWLYLAVALGAADIWQRLGRTAAETLDRQSQSSPRSGPTARGRWPHWLPLILLSGFIVLNGGVLAAELHAWKPSTQGGEGEDYAKLTAELGRIIPPGQTVLSGLNTGFAFAPGQLRVWHDLAALPARTAEQELLPVLERPFGRFLLEENISWLVLPAGELELIYSNRPVWNALYGNPYRFYPDLLELLALYGTKEAVLPSRRYAMRLVPYMQRDNWFMAVYRLKLPAEPQADGF